MLTQSRVSDIKRAQRESFLFREFSKLYMNLAQEKPEFKDLHMSRISISADKGRCSVLFYSPLGYEFFQEKLPLLILYKPSLRKALSHLRQSRYSPDSQFA